MGGGVWYSDDYGETWDIFDREGLACFGITSLIVDPVDSSRIYAATAGTGIWRYGPDPSSFRTASIRTPSTEGATLDALGLASYPP